MHRHVFATIAAGLVCAALPVLALGAPPPTGEAVGPTAESRAALRVLVSTSAAPALGTAASPPVTVEHDKAADAARLPPSLCTRKVKVVYAGYGEAERAACPATQRPDG